VRDIRFFQISDLFGTQFDLEDPGCVNRLHLEHHLDACCQFPADMATVTNALSKQ